MNIAGRKAIVTGGASGLGAACVRMILENGGEVVAVDLKAGAQPGCVYVQADVADADQMARVVADATQLRVRQR